MDTAGAVMTHVQHDVDQNGLALAANAIAASRAAHENGATNAIGRC
jgi:hypothetical protein